MLSIWTGIPVYKLTEEETEKLINMEAELHKRIIGQESAVASVSQSIRRTRAGLKDPKRPSGSFIFLGPTGVGKTELAKTLAEFLFGDDSALITLDMSEYMEKHTVSRLVGSPPGYVGYEEGGQLTEAVRRKPFSVVLFDEIEKAHPDVFNTLLQILEEGRLTDSQGRSVDFRNTVLIMTSNLGTADLRKANVGFTTADSAMSYERMKDKVMEALKKHFKPEFLNRIDEVIVFHEHDRDAVMQMVDTMTKRLVTQLEGQGLGIELTQSAKQLPRREGLRPAARRPSAAPGDPAHWSRTRCRRSCSTRSSRPARSSWSTPRTTPTTRASSASRSRPSRASCRRRRSSWPPRRRRPTARPPTSRPATRAGPGRLTASRRPASARLGRRRRSACSIHRPHSSSTSDGSPRAIAQPAAQLVGGDLAEGVLADDRRQRRRGLGDAVLVLEGAVEHRRLAVDDGAVLRRRLEGVGWLVGGGVGDAEQSRRRLELGARVGVAHRVGVDRTAVRARPGRRRAGPAARRSPAR